MRKILGLAAFVLVSLGVVWAAQDPPVKRSAYMDVNHGFAIFAPNFPRAPKQTVIPVMFTGPAEAGFSSNVNITIQAATLTRKMYRDQSLAQFRQLGFKVNSDRDVTVSGKDAIRLDYEGKAVGKDLHFLALAVIDKDREILVTCTATPEGFSAVESEFKACLDSFRLK
jgi:hypothetical protein